MPIEQDYCTAYDILFAPHSSTFPPKIMFPSPPRTIFIGNIIPSKKISSTIKISSVGIGSEELYVLTGDIKAGQFISAS